MKDQHSCHLFIVSSWICVLFLPSMCCAKNTPTLELDSTVFVAVSGENLDVKCKMTIPANHTGGVFNCFNTLNKKIFNRTIHHKALALEEISLTILLKNVSSSGVYYCTYQDVKVDWFLRVRAKGYEELMGVDYTEFIVAVFTAVLLLFSVFGSVFVFRGHWTKTTPECGDGTKGQNREDEKKTEVEEDNVDTTAAQSTSFYASLEPRHRSIYEVLDRSAAATPSGQTKTKSEKSGPSEMAIRTTEPQEDDISESVYENF